MGKIKLTKGELKKHRDALGKYERYLPTLQLKKQQLQMEILHQQMLFEEKKRFETQRVNAARAWSGLLKDETVDIRPYLKPKNINVDTKNIAGLDVPVFMKAEFEPANYDLFNTPLWVDSAISLLREIISIRLEMAVIEKGIVLLRQELLVTSQRVNLFEKIKIPQAKEAIRLIKIYIGDQLSNAVGRSKIAKRKIEEKELALAAAWEIKRLVKIF